jgi:hypothetical protein
LSKADYKRANFAVWDKVDPLSVAQAAFLWEQYEPIGHGVEPQHPAYPRFQQLKGELSDRDRAYPKGYQRVSRTDWKKIAKRLKERPAFLYPEVRGALLETVVSSHTGLPGRPTIAHLIDQEFEKRAAAGNLADTLKVQAEELGDWARQTHPNLPTPTPRTIENHIRTSWHRVRRLQPRT